MTLTVAATVQISEQKHAIANTDNEGRNVVIFRNNIKFVPPELTDKPLYYIIPPNSQVRLSYIENDAVPGERKPLAQFRAVEVFVDERPVVKQTNGRIIEQNGVPCVTTEEVGRIGVPQTMYKNVIIGRYEPNEEVVVEYIRNPQRRLFKFNAISIDHVNKRPDSEEISDSLPGNQCDSVSSREKAVKKAAGRGRPRRGRPPGFEGEEPMIQPRIAAPNLDVFYYPERVKTPEPPAGSTWLSDFENQLSQVTISSSVKTGADDEESETGQTTSKMPPSKANPRTTQCPSPLQPSTSTQAHSRTATDRRAPHMVNGSTAVPHPTQSDALPGPSTSRSIGRGRGRSQMVLKPCLVGSDDEDGPPRLPGYGVAPGYEGSSMAEVSTMCSNNPQFVPILAHESKNIFFG